jgi:hypothetical protein
MEPISRLQFKEEVKQLVNEGVYYINAVSIISNKYGIDFMHAK